jgi:hypothetical protein
MEEFLRPLASALGRLILFWLAWWILTVGVVFAAFEGSSSDLTPQSWHGIAIVVLLFFSGGYGTVMLVRGAVADPDAP